MPDLGEVFKKILDTGGLLGALLILSLGGIVFLFRRLQASETARIEEGQKCAASQEALYEKRLEDTSRMTLALERNAATSVSLIASSDARNTAFQEMVKGFAVLVETMKADQVKQAQTLERIERRQERILEGAARDRDRPSS